MVGATTTHTLQIPSLQARSFQAYTRVQQQLNSKGTVKATNQVNSQFLTPQLKKCTKIVNNSKLIYHKSL